MTKLNVIKLLALLFAVSLTGLIIGIKLDHIVTITTFWALTMASIVGLFLNVGEE